MAQLFFYIVSSLLWCFSLLPLRVHYFFARCFSFVLGKLVKYRYSTVITNISRAFPDKYTWEVSKIADEFYQYLCDMVAETLWSYTASDEQIGRLVDVEGSEEVNRILASGKNAIVMLGHIGNWELFTGLPELRKNFNLEMENKNLVFVYKRPESKVADMLISSIRNRHQACSVVEMKSIVRQILTEKNGGNLYFLLCDQSPDKGTSPIMVDFLHQPTYMIDGPESIARKLSLPVLYCGIARNGRSGNIAKFKLITEDASRTEKGEVTRIFAQMLQKDIEQNPSTWLWSHKKWKRYPNKDY